MSTRRCTGSARSHQASLPAGAVAFRRNRCYRPIRAVTGDTKTIEQQCCQPRLLNIGEGSGGGTREKKRSNAGSESPWQNSLADSSRR